jgi:hypothetical protein
MSRQRDDPSEAQGTHAETAQRLNDAGLRLYLNPRQIGVRIGLATCAVGASSHVALYPLVWVASNPP